MDAKQFMALLAEYGYSPAGSGQWWRSPSTTTYFLAFSSFVRRVEVSGGPHKVKDEYYTDLTPETAKTFIETGAVK